MEYLLDTNTCVYILKRRPAIVLERFERVPLHSVAVSAIVVAELLHGVEKSDRRNQNEVQVRAFLRSLLIIDFDAEAAAHYGDIRATLERKGTPIGPLDMLIAAHARSRTLVTNNSREFARVDGLNLENWIK